MLQRKLRNKPQHNEDAGRFVEQSAVYADKLARLLHCARAPA